jgi:type II secretory pathway pseudopilin PulG
MVMAMVALVVVTMLAASLSTTMLALHRQSRVLEQQMQAEWLADSAVQRTAAQLARDPNFAGETWTATPQVKAGESEADTPHGVVVIRVERIDDAPGERRVTIAARYPDDPLRRVLATRETTIQVPTTGELR